MTSSINNQDNRTEHAGLVSSDISDVFLRHDQHFLDHVAYVQWERSHNLQRDIAVLLSHQNPSIALEFQKRIQQLEVDKQKLQGALGNFERENTQLRAGRSAAEEEIRRLHVCLEDVGLCLAQAYKFRQGSKEEIRDQFEVKGVPTRATDRLVASKAFLDEVGGLLASRRSERIRSKVIKSPTEMSQ